MKRTKTIIMLFLMTLLSCNVFSATTIPLSQLKGTWEAFYPEDKDVTDKLTFTNTTMTSYTYWKTLASSVSFTKKFYLDNKLPQSSTTFDVNAVGKNTYGNLIILFNDKRKHTEVLSIEGFDGDILILQSILLEPTIGGTANTYGRGQLTKYKRVK